MLRWLVRFLQMMSKWQNLMHRLQLAITPRWFLELEKDLRRLGLGNPSVVFDAGAHLGQTSLHFRKVFPNARIHCFEPVSITYQQLVRNLGGRDRVFANNSALGSRAGRAFVHEGSSDLTHSISLSSESPEREPLEGVSVDTIDAYVERKGIDRINLLKIDTEGCEIEVLAGAEATMARCGIDAIFAECDFDPEDIQHTYFPDLLEVLATHSFRFFGLYDVIHYGKASGVGYCNALFLGKKAVSEASTS